MVLQVLVRKYFFLSRASSAPCWNRQCKQMDCSIRPVSRFSTHNRSIPTPHQVQHVLRYALNFPSSNVSRARKLSARATRPEGIDLIISARSPIVVTGIIRTIRESGQTRTAQHRIFQGQDGQVMFLLVPLLRFVCSSSLRPLKQP